MRNVDNCFEIFESKTREQLKYILPNPPRLASFAFAAVSGRILTAKFRRSAERNYSSEIKGHRVGSKSRGGDSPKPTPRVNGRTG